MQQARGERPVSPWRFGFFGISFFWGGWAILFALERIAPPVTAWKQGVVVVLSAIAYGVGLSLPLRKFARSSPRLAGPVRASPAQDESPPQRFPVPANVDRVTGLADRSRFLERLRLAIGCASGNRGDGFSVLLLDLDRFKLVNDTLGHPAGDDLLRQVAVRLDAALRIDSATAPRPDRHLVARFGGDEFAVLLEGMSAPGAAERIARRILAALDEPYRIRGHETRLTASIGIVRSEQGCESADAVLRDVDTAMYGAKRSGPGRIVEFDPHMRRKVSREFWIETELRKAIGTAQLSLAYQPILSLDTLEMTSVEALVRWNHPGHGPIAPDEFIPIAEQSGLIVRLDEWVQREACLQWRAWRDLDPQRAPPCVSVNFSRAQMAFPNAFLAHIRVAMEAARMPPGSLRLEVTERDVMCDPDAAVRLLQELRDLGISLAMDDFGTGTSSLACLRRYPFDLVKIDRAFIADLNAASDVRAVVRASVMLIESLGKRSVAEGVECPRQVEFLRSIGCHSAQGFLFGCPTSADRILDRSERPGAREPAVEGI